MTAKVLLPITKEEQKWVVANAATATTISLVTVAAVQPSFAQSATPGITEMQGGVTAISGLVTTVIPVAVGVLVFSAGALVVKRLLFA